MAACSPVIKRVWKRDDNFSGGGGGGGGGEGEADDE